MQNPKTDGGLDADGTKTDEHPSEKHLDSWQLVYQHENKLRVSILTVGFCFTDSR